MRLHLKEGDNINEDHNPPEETPTYVSAAFVLSMPLESIPSLKKLIGEAGARILYQKVSVGRLKIIEDNGK